ncbi:MAG: NADPH:quinone oxidoreductase family protein [Planctomycetaceae bacterium]
MHAIVCHEHGDPDVMRYEEIPQPKPQPDEVLIEAEAIGVNYVDTMRRSGQHPAAPPTPFTPGVEVCGRVAATGGNVTRFRVGDRVIGRRVTHGTYAEFVLAEERLTVSFPEMLSAEQGAALFVNGQTAYHALVTMGQTQTDEWVLVTAAAGGVGTCAIQIAKRLGARVIAAVGTQAKCAFAGQLGADQSVDYHAADWPEQVLELTGGQGAHLILESVGGELAAGCLRCWAAGGRMVVYGKASGSPALIAGDDLLFGNRTVYGLAVGTVIEDEAVMREAMWQLGEWVREGHLKMQVGHVYPLSDAAQAHRDLESRRTSGKLVLIP